MTHRHLRGFTLIEVIVALTLLSLIMLGLLSALRSLADSSRRTDENTQRIDQIRLVSDFLRRSIGQAMPIPDYNLTHGHINYFQGDREFMRWIAPFPAHHGGGGLYVMQLRVLTDPPALQLEYYPYPGELTDPANPPQPATHLLLDRIDFVRFQYRRNALQPWTDQWKGSYWLPGQVRIKISRDGREWPDLIIALRASEKSL